MIGPGVARELTRQREREIADRATRPRLQQTATLADALPAVSVVAGVLLALALGAPTAP
jgi:hypothetical protein